VQISLLRNINQHAAHGMHNTFRHPRRAARIHNQKRIPERHALKHQFLVALRRLHKRCQGNRLLQPIHTRQFPRKSRLGNHAFESLFAFHARNYLFNLRSQVNRLAIIHGPIIHENISRLDLQKALQYALCPHIRTTATKQSTKTRNRHETHKRIETRARNHSHAIAFLQAFCAKRIRQQTHAPAQIGPGQMSDFSIPFADFRQCDLGVVFVRGGALGGIGGARRVQDVFREVEISAVEPMGDGCHWEGSVDDLV
jgi:hypothetical protein